MVDVDVDFRSRHTDMASPAIDVIVIALSDLDAGDHNASPPYRSIMLPEGGVVIVDTLMGKMKTLELTPGQVIPVIVTKIHKNGTTAPFIYGFV